MPELPEAESIATALDRALRGCTVTKVEVFSPRLRTPIKPLETAGLVGLRINGVRRRARYAVADLSDGRALLMHFGMSGVVRVEGPEVPRRKHEHVFLWLSSGKIFRFEDPRRFGLLEVQPLGEDGWPVSLSGIGVEPLSAAFTAGLLHAAAARRRGPAKLLIMDNSVVSGIGNIYAAETLFAAGISPLRPASELTLEECGAIVKNAKRILRAAIKMGGTTVSDFLNVDGSEGKFAQKLMVYGKSGQCCPKCGTVLVNVKLGGRGSVFCPKCQH